MRNWFRKSGKVTAEAARRVQWQAVLTGRYRTDIEGPLASIMPILGELADQ